MRRREFIASIGGVVAWPFVGHAQQRPLPVVGYLSFNSPDERPTLVAAFRQGLEEAGFVVGQKCDD
jgi:putative ABC transport system substrate-binding protein